MSMKLRDLIKAVRACKTAAEERATISKESAAIRTAFKEDDAEYRHRNVAKLLYIHMLGYPTHWGQMECLKLIASSYYADKRIGYLALMLLMDEKQELLTMVTNHMKNDLSNPNHFIGGLALCALGNISSAGIARDLAPEVEKLLGSSNPYLRKKAALCAIRVLRKCPDLMENFVPRIRSLLSERNHGVLITGVSLMIELCEADPHNVEFFRRLVPTLVRILKNLVMSGYAPEYDVSGVTDPFLQVKILRLLRLLGKGDQESSEIMNDILAQVATNTDHSRNVGNSILYECVQTIMSIESDSALRVLAINVLGNFLTNRDNNIRYVALNTLTKVVSTDVEAVQRHRNTIVDCLKDPDVSIRRRALDLIYALVNENNIKVLANELLTFLQTATSEFRADLAAKLCNVTERFAPNKRWHVDTILKVMQTAGSYVPEDVASNLVNIIASTPELHSYAVQKMYLALTNDTTQQILIQVGAWCIGEFGDLLVAGGKVEDQEIRVSESDVIDLLAKLVKAATTTALTKEYILTAFMKLTTRFSANSTSRLQQLITAFQDNIDVELQQRSCEYTKLFKWDNVRRALLEKIPVQEVSRETRAAASSPKVSAPAVPAPSTKSAATDLIDILDSIPSSTPASSSTPAVSSGMGGGLDVLQEIFGGSSPTMSAHSNTPASPSPAQDLLGGLLDLGIGSTPSASSPALNATPVPTVPQNQTFVAYNKDGILINFEVAKQQNQPNILNVTATVSNSLSTIIQNFSLKAAVPTYIKLQVNPPSGTALLPNNTGKITQVIRLLIEPGKPVLMKIKLDYVLNGAPVSTIADVQFPPSV